MNPGLLGLRLQLRIEDTFVQCLIFFPKLIMYIKAVVILII